jgi:hypothetical protein
MLIRSARGVALHRVHTVTLVLAMNLTRAARSSLADPRRRLVSVLTVMFLVLAALAVQAVCGIHPHEADHGGTPLHGAVEQHARSAAPAAEQAGHTGPEHRTVTARYDRTLSPSVDLARVPSLAQQWLVPDITEHAPRVPPSLAVAAAPSLHALGISRT